MRRQGWAFASITFGLAACNGLTGASDLRVCETCADDAGVDFDGSAPSLDARPGADTSAAPFDDGSVPDAADAGRTDASGGDAALDAGTGCLGAASCVRLVFVTSVEYDGALGGVSGADARCQARAALSPLLAGRTFLAWISSSMTSPSVRFTHGTQPYVRLDGMMIASDWNDLTDGSLKAGLLVDELGGSRSGNLGAWTATSSAGATFSAPACLDWTSAAPAEGGTRGNVGGSGNGWSGSGADSCAQPHALYCFEK